MKPVVATLTILLSMMGTALASTNDAVKAVAHAKALVSNCPERFQYLPGMEKAAAAFAKAHRSDVDGWLATENDDVHKRPSSDDDDQDIVDTCTKGADIWQPEAASAVLNGKPLVGDRGESVYKSLIDKIAAKKSRNPRP